MAGIVLKNVRKVFDNEVVAVENMNLEIEEKEFLVLVGPSGCGKSTTLRMIAGLDDANEGEIYIGDKFVNNLMPKDRNIAMVFQNYALYPHMRVYDNIGFSLKLSKTSKSEIAQRVKQTAELLGIQDLLDRKPRQLSGGQKQRVALGRAIIRNPGVFLFDEPLSNLDAKLRVQMREEIKKLHQRLQTTVVYVTHDQVEAMTMGTRIVVMKEGVVQQVGKPLELYNNPANLFVAGFIGSPAMNLLEARLIEKNGLLFLRGESFELAIPDAFKSKYIGKKDKDVIFGIRPDHIFDKELTGELPNSGTLHTTIEIVEPMGASVVLVSLCGSSKIVASVDAKTRAVPQAEFDFLLDMNQIHMFDKDSGMTC
jgi:multiple sugar transport system ATP-binding protein